jgi:hypothetical protein
MITITLLNNFISATGGNHLNADLTGDGQSDITIANAAYGLRYTNFHYMIRAAFAGADLNGVRAFAGLSYYDNYAFFRQIGSQSARGYYGHRWPPYYPYHLPSPLTGSIPISFRDLQINNGRLTHGFLDVTATIDPTDFFPRVQLDSFTYNTSVPDQGSSLALLAMGAGGILALRRWRAARAQP